VARIGLDLRFWRQETAGLGRYSRNLLAELLRLETAHKFVAIITPKDVPEFDLQAANLERMVVDVPHYSLAEQTQFPKLLKGASLDLVHFAHFNHPLVYRGPFVVTIHDLIMHRFPEQFRGKTPLHRMAYRKVVADCARARRVIVPSESTARDVVELIGYPREKIAVTLEGSEEKFHPATPERVAEVRTNLGLPDQFLLFVSRWEPYKGLPVLLGAHQALVSEFPELGLVITGKPDRQNPEIVEMVRAAQRENPRILTPGFVSDDDLPALYSAASVYVHPSWYEGFGIMILEAFAAGVPVVTSNVSSLPEVVGDAGLLADPRNADEVAARIREILSNPARAQELRKRGLERVAQFSWAKMAKETLAVYDEVLGELS
jgi:glycosyltransferase involved in cell wall biosynthesis